MHQVYLDNAATTKVKPEVLEAMLPYLNDFYGNASSVYDLARKSKQAIENSREKIAALIGAEPKEIFFTASGTEADNWALKGLAYAHQNKGKHIITSQIEHHAVLHSCQFLEKNGFEVTYLPVDEFGLVSLSDLEEAIRPDTILISIMFANNEIGTIQPVAQIAQLAKEKEIIFHTDGVQAVSNLEIDVKKIGIDAMSISAHKFHAPKGIGALYLKNGLAIENILHGGSQERELRAGTENVAAIVAMAKALELAYQNLAERTQKMKTLRDRTIKEISDNFQGAKLNGHSNQRLPGNVNFSFPKVEGDVLLMQLDMKGISASSGSACSSLSIEPSHVLLALGLDKAMAKGSLRITFGDENTSADLDYLLATLKEVLPK
jgi:cysteine desulfurase